MEGIDTVDVTAVDTSFTGHSVYGDNEDFPLREESSTDSQMSVYGMTKKANELQASVYRNLYGLRSTGLRFFTVYGPWGRPDMALFLFTDAILHDRPLKIFGNGEMRRDFTYVDDIVEGVIRVLDRPATENPEWSGDEPDSATSNAPYRLYNIGNSNWVELDRYISVLEDALGRKAQRNPLPLQPGDVPDTFADVDDLVRDLGYRPSTNVEVGIGRFVDWYLDYYGIESK